MQTNTHPDPKDNDEMREAIALIEQRLTNCSIKHSQENSDAKWIDGVCITPTLAVQEIMHLISTHVVRAQTDGLLKWLGQQDPVEVQKFFAMIVYRYMMQPTNATKLTVKVEGLSYKNEPIGDIEIVARLKSQRKGEE